MILVKWCNSDSWLLCFCEKQQSHSEVWRRSGVCVHTNRNFKTTCFFFPARFHHQFHVGFFGEKCHYGQRPESQKVWTHMHTFLLSTDALRTSDFRHHIANWLLSREQAVSFQTQKPQFLNIFQQLILQSSSPPLLRCFLYLTLPFPKRYIFPSWVVGSRLKRFFLLSTSNFFHFLLIHDAMFFPISIVILL